MHMNINRPEPRHLEVNIFAPDDSDSDSDDTIDDDVNTNTRVQSVNPLQSAPTSTWCERFSHTFGKVFTDMCSRNSITMGLVGYLALLFVCSNNLPLMLTVLVGAPIILLIFLGMIAGAIGITAACSK